MKKATGPFRKSLSVNTGFKRLLGGSRGCRGMRAGLVTLKPGRSVGCHNSGHNEEALVILKGRGRVSAAGKSVPVKEGMFVYFPCLTEHNVGNTGKSPLTYVYITSPAG